ncbi:tRNA pseudouridine synthase A-like [Ostrea edulis]|uniref:tRNA pseudouridine synthase A-like n=1 Tax=Ostrea edulis TaxID=37623 RepID=UPI0024AE9C27|nr:tRNA pseudouridine synthase A-like [Ostrea edulis]
MIIEKYQNMIQNFGGNIYILYITLIPTFTLRHPSRARKEEKVTEHGFDMIREVARRYFIRLSYDGTKYRGVSINQNLKTVELAVSDFLKQQFGNNFSLRSTSRTDAGVHGISNILQFVLYDKKAVIDTKHFSYSLNYHLRAREEEVRVHNIQEIPFYRNAVEVIKQRVYIYRLAVFKELMVPVSKGVTIKKIKCRTLPEQGTGIIFNDKTCTTLSPPFSVDKLIESTEILSGVNNIYNCTSEAGHVQMRKKRGGNRSYIRNVQIDVRRGHPMLLDLHPHLAQELEFWEIHFKSHSYIYKQIRRMVGLMVGYAQGEYSLELLRRVISGQKLSQEDNTTLFRVDTTHTMQPRGLFLQNVECHEEILNESCSTDNPYIQLLANLSILRDMLYNYNSRQHEATLQDLSTVSEIKLEVEGDRTEQHWRTAKLRGSSNSVLIQTKLGVIKANIY